MNFEFGDKNFEKIQKIMKTDFCVFLIQNSNDSFSVTKIDMKKLKL